MKKYEIGRKVCEPCADAIQFDMADDVATLVIKIRRPTAGEKKSFANGLPFKVAMVEDIVFVLVQLDGIWMDAPYCKALSLNLTSLPEEIPDGSGIAIHALLIDASTGILVNQKLFSPDTKTSRRLLMYVKNQPAIPGYMLRLRSVYDRYTTEDLLRISLMQETEGN